MAYTGETTAYLVAGREIYGSLSEDAFDKLCSDVGELARQLGQQLVVLPGGDYTAETGIAISQAPLNCVIGLLAFYTGTYPGSISYDRLITAVEKAQKLPWADIARLLPEGGSVRFHHNSDVALHLTACGPLAGGLVVHGALVDLRGDRSEEFWDVEDAEAELRADENGVAALAPGLDLVHGTIMGQAPQDEAVYGVLVAKALYEGPLPTVVDISMAAHRDRIAKLGALAGQSGYYLIGTYD
ncbi:MAG: hypothetical protein JO242_17550 [Streptosporangiaceae bacterium]|nr:hypothetical protein [Streptosporangiaceae bacterium]